MFAAVLVCWLAAGPVPTGQVAYLAGTSKENLTVSIVQVQTGEVIPVGPGERDGTPVWSPDGSRIAYVSTKAGGTAICIADGAGGRWRRLVLPDTRQRDLRWSPDNRRLAYTAFMDETRQVRVYDFDTKAETVWGGKHIGLMRPAWTSRNGIVAIGVTGKPGHRTTDLFWVTASDTVRIDDTITKSKPYFEWAVEPLGKGDVLAYESNDGGDREIFVYAPGRRVIDVSNHHAADWNPVWSPGGRSLAFESFRTGRRGIFRVSVLRGLVEAISATDRWEDWSPSWSPDGEWIVHVSNRTGNPELFITHKSGAPVRQLTDTGGLNYAPAWRPAP